jgi:hypothetical protein
VWVRDPTDGSYRPLIDADVAALRDQFAEHGRAQVLELGG